MVGCLRPASHCSHIQSNPIQIGFLVHVARTFTLPFASDPDRICAFRLILTTRLQATLSALVAVVTNNIWRFTSIISHGMLLTPQQQGQPTAYLFHIASNKNCVLKRNKLSQWFDSHGYTGFTDWEKTLMVLLLHVLIIISAINRLYHIWLTVVT